MTRIRSTVALLVALATPAMALLQDPAPLGGTGDAEEGLDAPAPFRPVLPREVVPPGWRVPLEGKVKVY